MKVNSVAQKHSFKPQDIQLYCGDYPSDLWLTDVYLSFKSYDDMFSVRFQVEMDNKWLVSVTGTSTRFSMWLSRISESNWKSETPVLVTDLWRSEQVTCLMCSNRYQSLFWLHNFLWYITVSWAVPLWPSLLSSLRYFWKLSQFTARNITFELNEKMAVQDMIFSDHLIGP